MCFQQRTVVASTLASAIDDDDDDDDADDDDADDNDFIVDIDYVEANADAAGAARFHQVTLCCFVV